MFIERCGSISSYGSVRWMTPDVGSSIAQLRLTLDDVAFLVVEPPDVDSPSLRAGAHQNRRRRRSASAEFNHPSGRTGGYPDDVDVLGELNRFLLFSAGNASLEWTGPEVDRT